MKALPVQETTPHAKFIYQSYLLLKTKSEMKKMNLLLLAVMGTVLITSCEKIKGEGPVVTENRNVGTFAGVDLRGDATVYFTKGNDVKIELNGQHNVLNVLETYKSGSNLVIKYRNDIRLGRHEPVTIYLTAPDLNDLRISGSGDIFVTGDIINNDMEMDISGSGSINMDKLMTGYLDVNISGSGSMEIEDGEADEEILKISGSGNIYFPNLVARKAITTTSGSGDIRIHVTDELRSTISGSGSVYYKGQPSILSSNISGSGKVRPM